MALQTPTGLEIRFAHERGTWYVSHFRKGRKVEVEVTRRTVCEIVRQTIEPGGIGHSDVPMTEPLAQGVAYCSPSDTYDAETGRQVALRQAVTMLPKGCKDGAAVLHAYRTRPGAKPWRLDAAGHPLSVRQPRRSFTPASQALAAADERTVFVNPLKEASRQSRDALAVLFERVNRHQVATDEALKR